MKKMLLTTLVAIATLLPAAAQADVLLYEIRGTEAGKFTASFRLDTAAVPNPINAGTNIRFNGVPITYTLPNSTTVFTDTGAFDGPSFFLGGQNSGGLSLLRLDQASNFGFGLRLFGPQLFTSTSATPGLLTGTFALSDIQQPFTTSPLQVNYQLTVTNLTTPAAVPEPASWAMMIGGLAVVGGTLRRRRRTDQRLAHA